MLCLACLNMARYPTDCVLVQSKRGSGVNVTEEQLFEHERFMPLAGWSSRHLLPTERNRYSRQEDGMHSTNTFPKSACQKVKLLLVESAVAKHVFCITALCVAQLNEPHVAVAQQPACWRNVSLLTSYACARPDCT